MDKNFIYCQDSCMFCQRAYRILQQRGVPFHKRYVKSQADWNEVFEKTGRNTVPQVFIKGVYIGGSDDLYEADQTGKLDEILNG